MMGVIILKMEKIIEIKNMSVYYNKTTEKMTSLKEYFIKFLQRKIKKEKFVALENINLDIMRGEVVGIVGLNGAGKSTLLKVISGIMKPSAGSLIINGKIAPLIELGAGFDIELTGRENIFLNGSLLGFSRKELNEKIDDIIAFSELGEFIDIPIKNYSSGMYSRLGFSIATIYNPEILIIDEVLSVGDEFFRKKSLSRVQELIHGGSTVLMVSHGIGTILKNCTKVVWIEKGKLQMVGNPDIVCAAYRSQHN